MTQNQELLQLLSSIISGKYGGSYNFNIVQSGYDTPENPADSRGNPWNGGLDGDDEDKSAEEDNEICQSKKEIKLRSSCIRTGGLLIYYIHVAFLLRTYN